MTIRVLAIAPYPGLKDLLHEMAANEPSIAMDVEVADLQEAVPLAEKAGERGYHIVVSRGGTANLIRQYTSLPVVEIPVSGYDLLRVLTLVRKSTTKMAIIGHPLAPNRGMRHQPPRRRERALRLRRRGRESDSGGEAGAGGRR